MEFELSISDYILKAVLSLISRELPEHGRYYQQYFQLFVMYANLGMSQVGINIVLWFIFVVF